MKENLNIVIGIPAFNEEKNIASLIVKLKKIVNEVIVCNDGSTDSTAEIAERLGAVVINHKTNLGYGAAVRSIFLKASELNADLLVTLDADGQHRVEDVANVIEPIIKNQADIVIGSRFLEQNNDTIPEYRKLGIKIITKLTNASIHEKLTDSQSGFRAYNKKVLSSIKPSDYGMGVSTEILIKASTNECKIVEVPIKVLYEGDTSTHHPISHGASVIFSTMKFVSIEHPLKFYGIPGIVLSGIGLFFIIWTIQYFGEYSQFHPTLALIAMGSTISGIMFVMTAILLYSLINVVRERSN